MEPKAKKEVDENLENKNTVEEPELVSKDAYLKVSNDMHKYKQDLKSTKALLSQLQADKDAAEQEKLAEQGRWEDLYKASQEKLTEVSQSREKDQDKFLNYHKKNSVLTKLGGFKNEEYNNFINVEAVAVNEDGSIDESSLDQEVNRIKQSYPELLKGVQVGKLPNGAPKSTNFGEKTYEELTELEKDAYKRNLMNRPKGY